MADEHASFQEVTVVSLKTIAHFCSMLLLLALILTPAGSVRAAPGNTIRVSVASDGTQANGGSFTPSISADGRYVAFASIAVNLVSGDTNGVQDIFVHDRQTGQTTRVSVASGGAQANGPSFDPSISADGRYVAFASLATNLVSGDTNNEQDIFVHDRQTGQTTRVSVATGGGQANLASSDPSISADGRYVAFESIASNLVSGDTNNTGDIFVHDRQTGATTRVSIGPGGTQANRGSLAPSISADGRYVAFHSSATNLVSGVTNGTTHIFVHDRQTGATTRVSVASDGTEGNSVSIKPSISADGRYVAFQSIATNLVSGDTNGTQDIFVHDRQTGQTTRVSVASDGTEGNSGSNDPSISANGRYVAFQSQANNLVSGDTGFITDIFIHDRQTGVTTRVSIAFDGTEANNVSSAPSISADGRYIAFESNASNLVDGDTNGTQDIFVHDREDNTAPTVVSITRADPNPTSAASVRFTVTFSEPVTGVDASDFALTTTGSLSGMSVTSVSGSGNTYSVTVSTGTGTGTLRLDVIDNDTIIDAAGNPLGGSGFGNGNFTDGEIYTIQKAIFLPLIVR
ncbi:TolB family protein [Roseiflexus sp. RS-1]|uniref:TolB family protein n=1 Tax=Roseiflexus sp. (strain RS-1) TaxID=357808 RepID=UPI0018DB1AF3|nr:Ig-like domain-containing protein [Roseiflexus sp. RS-1]